MQLPVPYYSQFVDIQDPFWMLRACGMTSLVMVMEYHTQTKQDILSLCKEAQAQGGYHLENGWVHDYLVSKAKECGFEARREEGLDSLAVITQSLDQGFPVIISVEKRVLEQKRFHMIVVVGHEGDDIIYHDSEATTKEKGMFRRCTKEVLMDYWRGKAIFVTPAKTNSVNS